MKKYWLHIVLTFLIALPIVLLCFFDYYNVEGYNYRYNNSTGSFEDWDNSFLNNTFTFDVTWKGRMFYLIFIWLFIIESAFGWKEITEKKNKNRSLIAASLVCAAIPTVYVLATNFFGLDFQVLKAGQALGIISVDASNAPVDFLHLFWPLSLEYIVFFIFFVAAVMLAYKPSGIKTYAISFALLGGIGVAYMLDTVYPFGVFRPLQELALPITATAAALFDLLGYSVMLSYPAYGGNLLPQLIVTDGARTANATIAWACSGVYSLLLYVLIMLVFFKKTNISAFRKLLYFVIGLFGTFCSAVLRIYAIIIVGLNYGGQAGTVFHNTYAELFGFTWIFTFILLIVCIERFMLVEKTRNGIRKLSAYFRDSRNGKNPPV